nr:bacteriorhodopsin [Natronoarchaeum philippinense]
MSAVSPAQIDPLVEETLSNPVMASSLWVMIALMGVATILFVYMGRAVDDPRVKMIYVATIGIPAVSLSSYFGLATGLTIGVVDIAGRGEVVTMWGRYLTWTFSTPLILLALGLLVGSDRPTLFAAIAFDIGMCVTGLAAALTRQAIWMRWVWFGISSAFFLVVVYVLLVEWPRDAAAQGEDVVDLFGLLRTLTVVLWFGYPIVWALGTEGLAVMGTGVGATAITSWAYSLLDVGAKFVFAVLLLRFLADEPASVTGQQTARTGSPAED